MNKLCIIQITHGQNLDIFDATHLDVSNATNIDYTFYYTRQLTTLRGLENWETRNFTSLSNGFKQLYYLRNVNELANWNISKVTSLYNTFYGCGSLTDISGLSNWNTSNITSMTRTFYDCHNLTTLNGLENWDTSNLGSMYNTFERCNNLTTLNGLENWNTSNVSYMNNTFSSCTNLTDISALSNWNVDKITIFENTFAYCTNLTDISALDSWNWNSRTFNQVFGPDALNMNLGTHNVSQTTFRNTFPWSANFASFNNWYFTDCRFESLCSAPSRTTYLNFSISGKRLSLRFFGGNQWFNQQMTFGYVKSTGSINAQNVNFYGAYCGCTGLDTINNITVTNCDCADYMFFNCRALVNVNNLPLHFASNQYLSYNYMFGNCVKLNDVTCMENWTFTHASTISRHIYMSYMFFNCNNLSDNSLYAITNFFINIGSYVHTNCLNLYNNNSYSAFGGTNISLTNRLDADQKARLTSAGYRFN
jgi:surface protein